MDTRSSQPHRGEEETRKSEHSLAHGTPCTARDRARGWWSGGWFSSPNQYASQRPDLEQFVAEEAGRFSHSEEILTAM